MYMHITDRLNSIKNKTVVDVRYYNSGAILYFHDKTFTILKSFEIEGLSIEEIMSLDQMVEYGILTREEAKAIEQKRKERDEIVEKQTRFQEFEYIKERFLKLKEEFEP